MPAHTSQLLGLPALIVEAVRIGRLKEPFTRDEFETAIQAAGGYSRSYRLKVLANNEVDGDYQTGYFTRVAQGKYRVSRKLRDR